MVLPLLGALASGVLGMAAANKAARAQERSARDQIAYSEQTRDMIRDDLSPFRQGGETAWNALLSEYGLGARPTGYGGYTSSPGYDWQMQQGQRAIDGSAASRGNLFSGATLRAQQQFGQGLAAQDYGQWLAGLSGIAGSGQNAAAGQATALTNNNAMVNSALGSIGDARAAGAIGGANAFSDAVGNATGIWQYQRMMNPPMNALAQPMAQAPMRPQARPW